MMDVPSQYKPITDHCTIALMDAARRLWPIIRELGETFECQDQENGKFVVRIDPLPQQEKEEKNA